MEFSKASLLGHSCDAESGHDFYLQMINDCSKNIEAAVVSGHDTL